MPNPQRSKGDRAERELVGQLGSLLPHLPIERAYGAGRPEDAGDLDGLPFVVAQVKHFEDAWNATRLALDGADAQAQYRGAPWPVAFVRYPRKPLWVVSMRLEPWCLLYQDAIRHDPASLRL